MKLRLSQESGAQAGRQYHFDKDRVRVGRQPDNDVVFDANVDIDSSGRHCEIVNEHGAWHVIDVNSRNGTWVGTQRVERHKLTRYEVIECGKGGPRLRVDWPSQEQVAPTVNAVPPVGAKGATVAIPEMAAGRVPAVMGASALPLSHGPAVFGGAAPVNNPFLSANFAPLAPAAPLAAAPQGGPASVGQAMASSMPQGAQVGKRTVALMIDQALEQSYKSRPRNTGLKVVVGMLSLVVLVGFSAGAWVFYDDREARDEDDSRRAGVSPPSRGDQSSSGSRIALANESHIYLLAMVRAGQRDRGFCTGFAVTSDLIATNAHCINVMRTEIARGGVIVALRNKAAGVRIQVTPAYSDARFQNPASSRGGSGYDIGIVRTSLRLPGAVRLATDQDLYNLHEGDGLFVYGFPGLTMNESSPVATITLGLLNRLTDFFDNAAAPAMTQKLQHSAQTSGGSSGSPIFHPSGVVIGLNAGSLSDDEHQTIYDPVSHQQREVSVNRGSNFKYGMRADLIRQAILSLGESPL